MEALPSEGCGRYEPLVITVVINILLECSYVYVTTDGASPVYHGGHCMG